MPFSLLLLAFVVLVIGLSFSRVRLAYEFQGASLLIFGTTRPGLILYTLIFLPGTIIHELSHWLFAEILRVRTGPIQILPDFSTDKPERLGSVATARSDPFRAFLIGVAPFITGTLILFLLGTVFADIWRGSRIWWQLALLIYGLMVMGNSLLVSAEDRRSWPAIAIFLFILGLLIYLGGVSIQLTHTAWLRSTMETVDTVLSVAVGINLTMIGMSYGLRRIIEAVTGQRLTRR